MKICETYHQTTFFRWLRLQYPKLREYCFAIPNGGSRHFLEARNLKLQGVTSGIPDVFFAYPNGGSHGLFLEFKFGKNKLSNSQKEKFKLFGEKGYSCKVCYDWEEASNFFKQYIEGGE
jgi:VRR-NUC domain